MIDVVVNNVMATSTKPDYSPYMFNDASLYHPYCEIDWSNTTSEELCWLGDTKVALPDLNTRDATVVETYGEWIQDLVQTYNIDGLRIDGEFYFATLLSHRSPRVYSSCQACEH